jgi:hypothetical protein
MYTCCTRVSQEKQVYTPTIHFFYGVPGRPGNKIDAAAGV